MNFFETVLLASALCADTFAISLAVGAQLGRVHWRQYFRLCFHFALFQFLMPLAGWWCGDSLHYFVSGWGHWVAFLLLFCIGLNMIRESLKSDKKTVKKSFDATKGVSLLLLSIATSTDALAVGFSLAALGRGPWLTAFLAGCICALSTFLGLTLGAKASRFAGLGIRAGLLGGFVLLGIALNVLLQHGVFSW